MPTGIPAFEKYTKVGAVAASSTGTTVTGPVTINTKSSYVEIVASAAEDYRGLILYFGSDESDLLNDYLIDIAFGAGGSEVDKISNFLVSTTRVTSPASYFFPLAVPSGTRISARIQSGRTTVAVTYISLGLLDSIAGEATAVGSVETQGANTTDSGGVQVDPGASANTKGAYSEIVASTTDDWEGFFVQIGNQNNTARTEAYFLLDIAVGAAASEVVKVADIQLSAAIGGDEVYPNSHYIPIKIAAGSRVAARAQCSITDATDRLFDVAIYGIVQTEAGDGGGGGTTVVSTNQPVIDGYYSVGPSGRIR